MVGFYFLHRKTDLVSYAGWTTFAYTADYSAAIAYPYDINDPAEWGVLNTNWRDYATLWCQARDCSVVDCSPPMGCFPGTPPGFNDKEVQW